MTHILISYAIGHVSFALGNEVGGSWGQEVHILHVNYRTLFLVVMIELSLNSIFQLYCSQNNYKQKQWNTASNNDHEDHPFYSIIKVVAMASAASTCVWRC